MTQETIIDLQELQIALNLMGNRLKVAYPLYPFALFTAQLNRSGCKIKFRCEHSDFEKASSAFGNEEAEMPAYHDFRDCIRTSGIMPLENIDVFKDHMKSYARIRQTVKYSLDTNLLYSGFISNYDLVKPSEIVLVKTVQAELLSMLNKKYKPTDINNIKKHAKFGKNFVGELFNRRKKRSRKAAYLALREYQFIQDGIADTLEPVEKSSKGEGVNDLIIVKTLMDFSTKSPHILPVLLTADNAMVDLCEAEGLAYFKFDLKYDIDDRDCTYHQFCELLFNLAVVFGFIKINNIIVFGEFGEKSSNKPNKLKILFLNEDMYPDFEKELTICRNLIKLNI